MRFAAIYQARWTFSIQDPRMLELTKFEWWETLQHFTREEIMETISDVKKIPGDFPSIQKFHEIVVVKRRNKKAREEMERREKTPKLEYKGDGEKAKAAREAIRKLCRIKVINEKPRG